MVKDTVSSIGSSIVNGFISVGETIVNAFNSIGTTIVNGVSALGDFLIDGLIMLFVPTSTFAETSIGSQVTEVFSDKFGFVGQILDLANQLLSVTFDDKVPDFSITLQGSFFGSLQGKKFQFIDLSMYHQYRTFIHSIIKCLVWFYFILYLLRDIPCIVGGITSGTSMFKQTDEVDYSLLSNRSNSYDYY